MLVNVFSDALGAEERRKLVLDAGRESVSPVTVAGVQWNWGIFPFLCVRRRDPHSGLIVSDTIMHSHAPN